MVNLDNKITIEQLSENIISVDLTILLADSFSYKTKLIKELNNTHKGKILALTSEDGLSLINWIKTPQPEENRLLILDQTSKICNPIYLQNVIKKHKIKLVLITTLSAFATPEYLDLLSSEYHTAEMYIWDEKPNLVIHKLNVQETYDRFKHLIK